VWPGVVLGVAATYFWLAAAARLSQHHFDAVPLSSLPMMSMQSMLWLQDLLEFIHFPGIDTRFTGLLLLIIGPVLAAVVILLIRFLYWLIRRREGLGLGDAKLMAMIAAWLGLDGAMLAFSIGCILGAVTGLLLALPSSRNGDGNWALKKLPLGTFLCLGAIVSAFWGSQLIVLYMRWAGF
jgi:leader peptidase (prepilin peptidase)/N-methyltransferase